MYFVVVAIAAIDEHLVSIVVRLEQAAADS